MQRVPYKNDLVGFSKTMGADFSYSGGSKEEIVADLSRRTHFNYNEVNDWYDRFYKDFPDGNITKRGFIKLYKQMYSEGDATDFAGHVFRAFDSDGSGDIDFFEFMNTLSVTLRGEMDERLNWAFNMYDLNGDGKISRDEALDIIEAIYKMKGTRNPRQSAEDRAHELFIALDKNHDDELSRPEFINGAKKCSAFLDLIRS